MEGIPALGRLKRAGDNNIDAQRVDHLSCDRVWRVDQNIIHILCMHVLGYVCMTVSMYVCVYVLSRVSYFAAQHAEDSLVKIHDRQVDSAMRVHNAVIVHSHQYILSEPTHRHTVHMLIKIVQIMAVLL